MWAKTWRSFDSFISKSIISRGVQINRRNIIVESAIGRYSYTGANTININKKKKNYNNIINCKKKELGLNNNIKNKMKLNLKEEKNKNNKKSGWRKCE